MKQTIIILFGCLMSFTNVLGQGIRFSSAHNSWEDIVREASLEKKLIFVDTYTTWCSPCKKMDADIFPLKEVGDFFNQHFISVKIDAWNGMGVDFAKVNDVNEYPTYLFFSPDGKPVMRGKGAISAKDLIALGKEAIKNYQNGVSVEQIEDMMNKTDLSPDDFQKVLNYVRILRLPMVGYIERYLDRLPEDSLYNNTTFV
ncbi:MAG: thioredoxin family protein [Dysgonamonadaceae bacterium]|nr:thioredoxin family protein [Dysgonamonadaceae bacterium]